MVNINLDTNWYRGAVSKNPDHRPAARHEFAEAVDGAVQTAATVYDMENNIPRTDQSNFANRLGLIGILIDLLIGGNRNVKMLPKQTDANKIPVPEVNIKQ
ncbi:MAG TPA: hypothetical protein VMD02_00045 [Candidatus Omnitrophota bacterium]|nr:hypothetical protein [Candidatus Omnitrophota bacterium]